jgi:hypothetical protein
MSPVVASPPRPSLRPGLRSDVDIAPAAKPIDPAMKGRRPSPMSPPGRHRFAASGVVPVTRQEESIRLHGRLRVPRISAT